MDITTLAANQGFTTEEFLEIGEVFIDVARSDVSRMDAAINKKDAAAVAAAAHSLKGAAGNLGFSDLFEAAKKTEYQAKANDLAQAQEALSDVRRLLAAVISGLHGAVDGEP